MRNVKVMGSSMMQAGEYDEISIIGKAKAFGDIRADKIEIAGTFLSDGDLVARKLECTGKLRIHKNLKAQSCVINGSLHAVGESAIEAQAFMVNGSCDIKGSVHAYEVTLNGGAVIGKIVAPIVSVNRAKRWFSFAKRLKIQYMDAKQVFVDDCEIGTLMGENIEVAAECVVDKIICNGTLLLQKGAVVGTIEGEYTLC